MHWACTVADITTCAHGSFESDLEIHIANETRWQVLALDHSLTFQSLNVTGGGTYTYTLSF